MVTDGFEELQHFGMNTVMSHRAFGVNAREALRAVRAEAGRLERKLSRFLPGSDVSRVNRLAGAKSARLGEDAFRVLSRAVQLSECCGGLFDVTAGPLVALWSDARKAGKTPEDGEIRAALPLVGFAGLTLNPEKKTVRLALPGQSIDLGGIGKGYAADRFLALFREFGVSSAFSNIGGNVAALGAKPDGSPWRVGIRHPRVANGLIGMIEVTDQSIVTSGDDQRYFIDERGKRHHHILDPRTGYPAESGIASVTVVAKSSMDADALSTMLFIAGPDEGLRLLRGFPADAVIIDTDMRATVTAGLRDRFQAAEGVTIKQLS